MLTAGLNQVISFDAVRLCAAHYLLCFIYTRGKQLVKELHNLVETLTSIASARGPCMLAQLRVIDERRLNQGLLC